LAIACAAVELGIDVYRPVGEGGRNDLIFDLNDELCRIQCKWAPRVGDVIVLRCYSCRRNRDGLLRRKYVAGEVDAFAAYCPDNRKCYFLPAAELPGRSEVLLRLEPSKNNQRLGINWAEDYEFAARLGAPGAIAQLGERLLGMQEVAGSNP